MNSKAINIEHIEIIGQKTPVEKLEDLTILIRR